MVEKDRQIGIRLPRIHVPQQVRLPVPFNLSDLETIEMPQVISTQLGNAPAVTGDTPTFVPLGEKR